MYFFEIAIKTNTNTLISQPKLEFHKNSLAKAVSNANKLHLTHYYNDCAIPLVFIKRHKTRHKQGTTPQDTAISPPTQQKQHQSRF